MYQMPARSRTQCFWCLKPIFKGVAITPGEIWGVKNRHWSKKWIHTAVCASEAKEFADAHRIPEPLITESAPQTVKDRILAEWVAAKNALSTMERARKEALQPGWASKNKEEPEPDLNEPPPDPNSEPKSEPEPALARRAPALASARLALDVLLKAIGNGEGGASEEKLAEIEERLSELESAIQEMPAKYVIQLPDGAPPRELPAGLRHERFEEALSLCALRINVLLIGPAGCGKTHLASQVAEALAFKFYFVSCSAGMSEAAFLGRLLPTGEGGKFEYTPSPFVRAYEDGGVCLLDELDAADANLMLCVNSALANGHLAIPARTEKQVAARHKDFVCVAAANTFGTGSDRMYVGRNQLDEATLDRFRAGQIEMGYDEKLEKELCPDVNLRGILDQVRKHVMEKKLRRVVSTRFYELAYRKLKSGKFSQEQILHKLTLGWSETEKAGLFI